MIGDQQTYYLELFPTPVMVINDFLNEIQIQDIFNFYLIEKNISSEFKNHNAFIGNSVSTHAQNKNVLLEISNKINSCVHIQDTLFSVLKKYENFSGLQCNKIGNSWINIQQSKSKLKMHTHPLSNISGVIYINVDEKSSNIYFKNINPFISFSEKNTNNYTNSTFEWYKIVPQKGQLIIFPSWLSHGSNDEENETENRMIISFNAQ